MRKSILISLVSTVLIMVALIPAAMAITVDGVKSPNEWNEDWAFCQDHGTTYDPNGPFGDRAVVRQGAYSHSIPGFVTDIWYDIDPKNDSDVTFDISMATEGESSGLDLSKIYSHYDHGTDTLYGMGEVYGLPADLDGNLDTGSNPAADVNGTPGPAGFGLGDTEVWYMRIIQVSTGDESLIVVTDNDWYISLTDVGMVSSDVDIKFTTDQYNPGDPDAVPKSVYEISIADFSTMYDLSPGQVIAVETQGGSSADGIGEDYATIFACIPDPEINIVKYVQGNDGVWYDANTLATGPVMANGSAVSWKYVVTNTGDEPLENVAVNDNKIGAITCPKTTLNASESMTCTATGTVLDPCVPYANMGYVEGVGVVSGITVTDEDPAHYRCSPPDVPALTPAGLMALIGILGMIGIVGLRRRT
jgi:hypothetical protein